MNTNHNASAPVPDILDGGNYIHPCFDSEEVCFIDESNTTIEQILDFVYVPPSPMDIDVYGNAPWPPSCDPRKTYHDNVRKITMDSLSKNGSIVGGPHLLPPKSILFADVEARERALRTDGTQYDGPSGTVSWHYRADMAAPRPILPTSSVIRFQNPLAREEIGIDPLETIGVRDIPAWRAKEEDLSKKEKKRFDPIQKKKKASPKKRR